MMYLSLRQADSAPGPAGQTAVPACRLLQVHSHLHGPWTGLLIRPKSVGLPGARARSQQPWHAVKHKEDKPLQVLYNFTENRQQ